MKFRKLGKTDLELSVVSFGASSLGKVFGDVDDETCVRTVHAALDAGINFIDCSPYYGITLAETNLGRAFKEIDRERYILATKVGRYGDDEFDFSATRVTRSVDESLQRMNVDHIDLIQCHDIEYGDLDQVVNETLPALQKIKESGKVRYIGITGLPLYIFKYVIDRAEPGMVDSILSYCRFTLNDQGLTSLFDYLDQKGIGIINASPTGMSLLVDRQVPDWHPAPKKIQEVCQKAVDHCKAKGIDIVELAMQYSISDPHITTTLVGTANPDNIIKNVEYADGEMDQDLLKEVQEILEPIHNQSWPSGRPENNDMPFRPEAQAESE